MRFKSLILISSLVFVILAGFSSVGFSYGVDDVCRLVRTGEVHGNPVQYRKEKVRKADIPAEITFLDSRPGDTYYKLTADGEVFGYARENLRLEYIEIEPTKELTTDAERAEFYEKLLGFVYQTEVINGETPGVEVITKEGDMMNLFFSQKTDWDFGESNIIKEKLELGDLEIIKEWQGRRSKFFQMMFRPKGSDGPYAVFTPTKGSPLGIQTAFVLPEQWVWINGAGTVGTLYLRKAREKGYRVAFSKASVDSDMRNLAMGEGFRVVALDEHQAAELRGSEIPVFYMMEEFTEEVKPFVIDATPGPGKGNPPEGYGSWAEYYIGTVYEPNGLKWIAQGGEKGVSDILFATATSDWKWLIGAKNAQKVSCNTTASAEILAPLLERWKLYARGFFVRRDTDLGAPKGQHGLEGQPASHHYEDVLATLRPELRENLLGIDSIAYKTPQQFAHMPTWVVTIPEIAEELSSIEDHIEREAKAVEYADMIRDILQERARLAVVEFPKNKMNTSEIEGMIRNALDMTHYYMPIVQVVKGTIPGDFEIMFVVPQESIVIPDGIDMIDGMLGIFREAGSYRTVNQVIGIDELKARIEYILGGS